MKRAKCSRSKVSRDPRGPLIGYAIGITNGFHGVELLGIPHEILEQLRNDSFSFSTLWKQDETGITSTEVFKAAPMIEIAGGEHAEAMMNLLDALEEPGLKGVARVIQRHPGVVTADGSVVALLAAVWAGALDAVQLLIESGLRPDSASHLGMTPLHWAAALGETEIATKLAEAGADPKRFSWFLLTPSELAQINKHESTRRAIGATTSAAFESSAIERVLARMAAIS